MAQKHSNLLAAKSALGLSDDAPSTSSSQNERVSGSTSIASRRSATHSAASGATTMSADHTTASGARDKRNTLHDLSATARLEARRFSVEESLEAHNETKRLPISPNRRDSITTISRRNDDTITFEEGSRDDSMATWTRSSHDTNSVVGFHSPSRRSIGNNSNITSHSSSTRRDYDSPDGLAVSSSNFGMSSNFNVWEKKVSFNDADAHHIDTVDTDYGHNTSVFPDSGSIPPLNKKVSFNQNQNDVRIVEHESASYNESVISSPFDQPSSHSREYDTSHQSLVSTESNFVPQRFDEMRSLLLNITPLQLEALVHEIFSNSPSAGSYLSVNSESNTSRLIPPEWKGIRKKSKRFDFRKDAYLGEMDFEELQNFAQSIELWSIVDDENCNNFEDAMDIFAIEFEMLVSGHHNQNGSSAGWGSLSQVEDDLRSYMSNNSRDEGENLRRSLRACSVPELKLVAKKLNLMHSDCGSNKTDLILLIENAMPDLHSYSENGNLPRFNPPPRGYLEQEYASHYNKDNATRSRRVKFSTDCKEDTSHLIPRREVNQAMWGNYVEDGMNDIEQNGTIHRNGKFGPIQISDGMKWRAQRRRFIIVGSIVSVIIGIALGLGLGLTKGQREGGGSPSSTSNILTGPWTIGYGQSFESTELPSFSPSTVESDAPSNKPTKSPTQQPIIHEPYNSGGISSVEIVTNSPTSSSGFDSEDDDYVVVTSNPTIAPTGTNASVVETTESILSTSPTVQITDATTTPLYPIQGPFDETGMRMILYGIDELSSMGQTQWKMLTSAFIEQFYNRGEHGDDAYQNIVSDVSADIQITDDTPLIADGGGMLHAKAWVITFTTNISYRTRSAFLDTDIVTDRPFIDETLRSNYIEYLMMNNGVAYIGNVTNISEIFRGDVPSEIVPVANDENLQASAINNPLTTAPKETLIPSSFVTYEPSIRAMSVLTPRPTLSAIDLTPKPTQNSFDFGKNTLSPSYKLSSGSPGLSTNFNTPFPTSNAISWPDQSSPALKTTQATSSVIYTSSPSPAPIPVTSRPLTSMSITPRPTSSPKKQRTIPPTTRPTTYPSFSPSDTPSSQPTSSPSNYPTRVPSSNPTVSPTLCDLVSDLGNCNDLVEVSWEGYFEIGQTHVVNAIDESRRAPRIIADREAELLFTPTSSRQLRTVENSGVMTSPRAQSIESAGKIYAFVDGSYVNNKSTDALLDKTGSNFEIASPDFEIIIDLMHLRIVSELSILIPVEVSIDSVRVGLRYDDGQNVEENGAFHFPDTGWLWHDLGSHTNADGSRLSVSFSNKKCRYINIVFKGGKTFLPRWSLHGIEVTGYLDALSYQTGEKMSPETRAVRPSNTRAFIPPKTTPVRIAIYSESGRLLDVINGRDPSKLMPVFENQVSETDIDPYSDKAWSATLHHQLIEEGNTVMIGCVDVNRPNEVLVNRITLTNLAQFSEHLVTRTKMAIFGTDADLLKLNPVTFDGRKLARNLHAVIPSSELKWADTDLWHLPYLVVISKDGTPVLVTSEQERRSATGVGTELSWEVMKNFLTIRHTLAQAGLGFALTSKEGNNSPYASHTSVFMGWSLSKRDDDGIWNWEDLGYWDTLAAAAWTGWVAMKAGDECSNYFIHEMGHAQSMQHFDNGVAADWGIEDEYPSGNGVYTPNLPWGYDTVTRQFRTWFDPLDGSGKKDPLNGEGEPPYSQVLNCFSQYTPYQAQISQEWAMSTPLLLSSKSSQVPRDGAYQFNAASKQYVPLYGFDLKDAAGEHAMAPDQVSIPVVTLIGTIGASRDVCQTYPGLRGYGNTFEFPDPFGRLSSAFDGASYFVEVRFETGRKIRGLIAVKDISELSLYSFNVAIDLRPIAVDLYRFVDGSYPNLSSETKTELLHIRPIELPPADPLQGMSRLLRVGRGWLGDSSTTLLNNFCISSVDCESDKHNIEWRGNVGSDHVIYRSTLQGENDNDVKATIFKVPALRQKDSNQYTITILAARYFNDGQGMSPLLTSKPISGDGSSHTDVTHMIRIWAPWELNNSLPAGVYTSIPDSFKISADSMTTSSTTFVHNVIEFSVACFIGTVTASPTFAPTKRPSKGPSHSPVQVRYYIDWKHGTCVTEGDSSEWAPPYKTKEECCQAHMGYEYNICISRSA